MKRFSIIFSFFVLCILITTNGLCIQTKVVIPDNNSIKIQVTDNRISQDMKVLLLSKMKQICANHGLVEDDNNTSFIMDASVDILSKEKTPTVPRMTALKLAVNMFIFDGVNNKIYSRVRIELIGIGRTEDKAYLAALKRIKPSQGVYKSMVYNGKKRIAVSNVFEEKIVIQNETMSKTNLKSTKSIENKITTNSVISNNTKNIVSDIDVDIPNNDTKNSNTFVVIIGNEKYDSEITVSYAINDAQTFYKYVTKTMGIPVEQVHLVMNATFGKMLREIQWISSIAQAFEGEARIIFYYAGHGMPDVKTKESYLLPVDGDASESATAISLDKIYAKLNEYPTKQATIFLDACFSGAARDGMLASGRGVRIVPKEKKPNGNLVVFSAVSGNQTAHPYESKAHGLFSYYLMKKLQETSGNITYGELSEYIKKEVNRKSVIYGNSQTPQVNVSHNLQDSWKGWTFK